MITELTDTTSDQILAELEKAHRAEGSGSGMVHTLLVSCQAVSFERAFAAARDAAREHPSRVILVVENTTRQGLDARVQLGEGVPGDIITLTVPHDLSEHLETLLRPLLLPDSPVVAWWPGESPANLSQDPVGRLATRRITDAGGVEDPLAALYCRALNHSPGDTDLTWTRLTPWRALLAAALDQHPDQILGVEVEAAPHNAPAELLAAWLADRLTVEVVRTESEGPGITGVRLSAADGDFALLRPSGATASYEVPGQPRRTVALARRTMNALIAEELRHAAPDEIFEDACQEYLRRVDSGLAKSSSPRQEDTTR